MRARRVAQFLLRVFTALGRGLWWLTRAILRLTLLAAVLGGLAAGAGYLWLQQNILRTLPVDLSAYRDFRPLTNCLVYDGQGRQVDDFYIERRIWVPLSELPAHVGQAFVAAEDRRFYQHPGVDVQGIARALVVNLRSGESSQGASTLTQQLVKNLIVGKERSYTRKLKEAVLALRLEDELSKDQLLELYLNYVALGSGNYGVEAAAQDYFGRSARELDPGQAALLAGLVPAPSRYSPRNDRDTAADRRRIVLGLMVSQGFLPADALDTYSDDPVLMPRVGEASDRVGVAYLTQVRREVRRLYGSELPFELGLKVYTPLDLTVQAAAEQAVRAAVEAHQDRQGRTPIRRRLRSEQWPAFTREAPGLSRDAAGQALPLEPGACAQAMVGPRMDLGALALGPYTVRLRDADRTAKVRPKDLGAEGRPLRLAIAPGDVLDVCATDTPGEVRLGGAPWSQAAAVVMEHSTGRVLALVGGVQDGLEGFVRATQARRQPGSSFKPYVYAAALLNGHSQLDTVVDGPIALPSGSGGTWSPKNYSGGYAGALPMREALARSLNTVAVRLALEVGAQRIVDVARDMGVQTPLRRDLTVALGSSELTPLDQARGYSTIANMGRAMDAVLVDRLENVDGVLLAQAGEAPRVPGEALAPLPGGRGRVVLPVGLAYELADMLRAVVESGTARKAFRPGLDRAGKTGTTNNYLDAWFVGFSPRHTIAVWVGTDRTVSLGEDETGGRTALPAWIRIAEALGPVPGERLALPAEAVLVPWRGRQVGLSRGRVPASILASPRADAGPLPRFPSASAR